MSMSDLKRLFKICTIVMICSISFGLMVNIFTTNVMPTVNKYVKKSNLESNDNSNRNNNNDDDIYDMINYMNIFYLLNSK